MNPKILIVEDNEVIAEQLYYFLKRYDYQCLTFDTGEGAIDGVLDYNPDLILMDIRLAGKIDGIETTRRIKEIKDYPVIFLTSHTEPTIIERAALVDPDGFVSKSISHSELKVQIDYTLIKHSKLKEQHEKLKTLESSTKIYEAIFNSSRDAIFFINRELKILYWNPAAERIFGYKSDEVLNRKISDLIVKSEDRYVFDSDFDNWMNSRNNQIMHRTLTPMLCNKNGRCFPSELTLGIVEDEFGVFVCGFARDITEKVIAEEEISKMIEEMQITKELIEQNASEVIILNSKLYESEQTLKELNASKDKFFSIIAHDLKGPFQGLLGYSQILTQDLNLMSIEEIEELGQSLNQSANQLFKLLENLLSWSRIQRGTIECNPIDFDLSLLAAQNIDLIKSRTEQKNIKLINNVPEELFVFADVNMVNTILRNLISNAVKFTPRGGVIELFAKRESSEFVKIEVTDTGVGMEEEMVQNVFEIDAYQSTPGTENEQGTGLGLILCKELIDKNNGKLKVESKIDEGTKFIISLPAGSQSN